MKNRQRWFKLMFIAILMVAMGGMAQAAVFNQLATGGGGFIGDASAYAEAYTYGDTDEYFDVWSPNDLLFDAEASVVFGTPPDLEEYAWGYQSTSAYYYYNAPQTSVTLLTELQSQAYSLDADTGFLDVSGLVQTAYDNYDYNGIFFEISPSAGESVGTPVQVTLDFDLLLSTHNGGFAEVKNGDDGGSSYLSLNGSSIWEYAPVELAADDSFDDLVSYTFAAQVGDVLGVNMLTVAGISLGEGSVPGDARTEATSFLTLNVAAPSPVPIPGAVWLLGSGFLGLVGIRRKMKRV